MILLILSAFSPLAAEPLKVSQYWLSDKAASLSVDQAWDAFASGDGTPITSPVFQLGNEPAIAWVYLTLAHPAPSHVQLRLLAGVPYSRLLHAYLIDRSSATPHLLINEQEARPFDLRNNEFRLLNSEPFVVAAGQSLDILVKTQVEGPSYLPFSILTEAEFTQLQRSDAVFGALFYGSAMTLGILFLLFAVAVRHVVAVLYAGLFLLGLLVMADIDGYAFQWLWPDSPYWNHFSPLVILPLLNALGFVIIHQLLHSVSVARYRRVKQMVLALAIISVLMPLLGLVWPTATVVQIENLLSIPAFLLQPLAFTAWLHLGRRSYVSLIALGVIALVVLLIVATVFMDLGFLAAWLAHLHHIAYAIVGVMVMGIITVQLMGLHKDQQVALKKALVLAQRNAKVNQALLHAEKNYAQAQRLASRHKQQLAAASHDLRQPIVSLRASVDAIAHTQSESVRQQLQEAFNYLEQLCTRHLQHTKPESGIQAGSQQVTQAAETYPVSLIFNTVQRMFAKEAASRNIDLRKVDCNVLLEVEPLAMMRIVSNLVSNAIKHYPQQRADHKAAKVLLGCRRKGGSVQIWVCDNGAGMSQAQLDTVQQPYQKGIDSKGEGLGLAIVWQLAAAHQLEISVRASLGRGTCFGVMVRQ